MMNQLEGQFILSANAHEGHSSWQTVEHSGWVLSTERRLPVIPFGRNDWCGWVLGFPLEPTGAELDLVGALTRCGDADRPFCVLEALLDRLSGRFLAVIFSKQGSRLYLDASGALGAVYCTDRQVIASTPTLVPISLDTAHDIGLSQQIRVSSTNHYFAFGTTPRKGVRRLLPNHYLDLSRLETIRHWPRAKKDIEQRVALKSIATLARGAVSAVSANNRPYLSLTAGRDSRMLLALSRDLRPNIQFMTWAIPDAIGYTDVRTARLLARRFRLDHRVFRYERPRARDLQQWLFRSGASAGEQRGMQLATTLKQMDSDTPYLPGLASEVGRGFYWRDGDEYRKEFSARELLSRLGMAEVTGLAEFADRWLDGVPLRCIYDILDLLYIEQRLGCWAGVVAYAEGPPHRIAPFSNRTIFENMMALPADYRKAQRLADDLIRENWPELLDVPFNPPDQRLTSRMRNAIAQTPLLWRLKRLLP
jgi:hypothetical protein